MLAAVTVSNQLDVVNGDVSSIAALIADDGNDGISLREAIEAANATEGSDEISFDTNVSGRTIRLNGTQLEITDPVSIDASCPSGRMTIDAQQMSRVFSIDVNIRNSIVSLKNLRITGGLVSGLIGFGSRGGGVYSQGRHHLIISNSSVTGNKAEVDSSGGGLFVDNYLTLNSSNVTGNHASRVGGGIYGGWNTVIENSTISDNTSGSSGGGIFNSLSADLEIVDSVITRNHITVHGQGGGIRSGDISIVRSTVSHNRSTGSHAGGGGISAWARAATVTDSTISNNSTNGYPSFGGGLEAETLTLTRSTVSNNETFGRRSRGGGIYVQGNGTVTESTILDNRTMGENASGGGIAHSNSTLNVVASTVTGNRTLGDGAYGGGIQSLSSVVIMESTVTGNTTAGVNADGGGVFAKSINLDSSAVSDNHTVGAFSRGGGLFAGIPFHSPPQRNSGSVDVFQSTITGNSTTGNDSPGGGVWTWEGAFSESTIGRNSTSGNRSPGGGIRINSLLRDRYYTLEDSLVSRNSTSGDDSAGGGIYSSYYANLLRSTVSRNATLGDDSAGGGIAATGDRRVELTDSTVSRNTTSGDRSPGGGIFVARELEARRSTISGNSTTGSASSGGGISTANGYADITESTVANNRASYANSSGGGISSSYFASTNSIIAANSSGDGNPDLDFISLNLRRFTHSLLSDTSNLTQESIDLLIWLGTNILDQPALLGPLAFNGGRTQTHALLPGSPAIDAGQLSGDLSDYDQRGRGFNRLVGASIDIGAYESGTASADFDSDRDIDGSDFLAWQRGVGMSMALHADGDADGDQVVDAADFSVWQTTYGTSVSLPAVAAALSYFDTTTKPIDREILIDVPLTHLFFDEKPGEREFIPAVSVIYESPIATPSSAKLSAPTSSDGLLVSGDELADLIDRGIESWARSHTETLVVTGTD